MKKEMSALDIKFCINELNEEILNAWAGKIYDIDGLFLFKMNVPGEGRKEFVIEPGKRIHLTEMKHSTPQKPPAFAMLLRKHLSNSKLVEINQPDFERIVELKFEAKKESFFLIAELFGEGNLILCDEDYKIISPYKSRIWKHRKLESGKKYELPPKKGKNLSSITKKELKEVISDSDDLVRGLASQLAIGGPIAEEICKRADLEKKIDPQNLSQKDYTNLFSIIKRLLRENPSARIIFEDNFPLTVIPFQFENLKDKNFEAFDSFNRALDHYFKNISKKEHEKAKEEKIDGKKEKIKSRLDKQKQNVEKWEKKAQKAKKIADLISKNHEKVEKILKNLNRVREDQGWKGVKNELKKPKKSREDWAKLIESVKPHKGKINLDQTAFYPEGGGQPSDTGTIGDARVKKVEK
ncbi:hypothetical protein AKJ49_02300, partial [candidate division MSBL1 archaeon SCGC-AAA382A03]